MKKILLILTVLSLVGCAQNSYCLVDQPYQSAKVVPELKPVGELNLPSTASSMRLPPRPENPIPFGRETEDGAGICLDKPPKLVIKQQADDIDAGSS